MFGRLSLQYLVEDRLQEGYPSLGPLEATGGSSRHRSRVPMVAIVVLSESVS